MAILGKDTLPLKRQRFVEALLGEAQGNATEAARIAGYEGNPASLGATASRLLKDVRVNAVVAAARESLAEATKRKTIADRVEQEELLTDILRGLVMEKRAIRMADGSAEFEECPPQLADRLKAIEQLGKRHGLILTKVESKSEVTGKDGTPLIPVVVSEAEMLAAAARKVGE